MTKKTSKLLTLLLAFSMVFTTFGYVGGYEVNAANTDTLSVKVVDQDSNPVTGLKLYVDNDDEGAVEFGPTNSDGEASHKFAWTTDGIFGELEKYEVSLSVGDSENWEITEGVVFTAVVSDPTSGYIETVNGESYDGRQVTIKLTAKGGDPQEDVDYVDMQKNDKNAWNANGISYADITASDFILDVRNDDAWKTGFLPGSVHISVNTQDTALVNEGKVVADSVLAKALDSAFAASEGKRIVVVCNSGNVLAARAMEYFNTKNYGGKGVDLSRVTFLIGGAAVIPAEKKVTTLDYIDLQKNNKPAWNANGIPYADITDDDFILDVRNDDAWKTGFLPGSVHISVNTQDTALVNEGKVVADSVLAKALDSAFAASEGKRIVVVCNSGNVLAARAMEYFNTKNYGGKGVDLSRVTFLIGGAAVIPAEKKVTTLDYIDLQKNNKPAWNANGIPYADITDDDFILDVRNDDLFAAGHLKGSTHVKVTDPASDLDNGYVKADSNMAKALDAAYAASGDKRIVVICNTGNSLAARALQYYNTKNCGGSGADYTKLTFLIGGYSVIPASDVVTDEDEAAADAIEDKINALPAADKVTTADKAAIEATRKAYDALSDAQKKLVDPSVLKKLTDAEAALKKAEDAKAKKVKTVTVNTKTVNAKAIDAAVKKAGGNEKYVTKIVLGKKVKKISKNSFKKYKKTTTLEIKTKKLKKSSVKGSLKGSKIKTVQVKVGKKKVNKKYVKKYKKIFTKKNAGKKVKVK